MNHKNDKHVWLKWMEQRVNNELKAVKAPTGLIPIYDDLTVLFDKAYEVKQKFVGNKAFYRGIIEFSNICEKDCYYCGIRRSNQNVERYMMKEEEILKGAKWAYENNYGSIVLQSDLFKLPRENKWVTVRGKCRNLRPFLIIDLQNLEGGVISGSVT